LRAIQNPNLKRLFKLPNLASNRWLRDTQNLRRTIKTPSQRNRMKHAVKPPADFALTI